jgi:hypothetical protein
MKVAWYLYPDRNDVQGQGAFANICKSEPGAVPVAEVYGRAVGKYVSWPVLYIFMGRFEETLPFE